jgi:uncharacterized protein YqeY
MAETSELAGQIERAMIAAMKARDAARTSALRMARAALKNREIEKRTTLTDEDVLQVLGTAVKQRREAADQYRAGNRPELAAKEEAEIEVLREFMPKELGMDELQALVAQAVAEVGAQGLADLGKTMSVLMPRIRGRADGRRVNEAVRAALGGQR